MGQYSKDERVDGILQNYLDMAYGASRTLNGMTGGGFDTLGDKYGFDTKMNGYLRLLPEQERLQREELAKYLQAGGAMLPVGKAVQVVGNILSVPYNAWKIGRAYDSLKQNPFSGSGQDVVARMKNHNGETVMLQRGEAIRGENGKVIVHGKMLQRQTGTQRNYGLNKSIYKHNLNKEQLTTMPKMLRSSPSEITEYGQHVYTKQTPLGEMRLISKPVGNQRVISSMYINNR